MHPSFKINFRYDVALIKLASAALVDSSPERESLAALGAIAGTAAVCCDVAAPVTTGDKLLRNVLENVTLTGRQLKNAS